MDKLWTKSGQRFVSALSTLQLFGQALDLDKDRTKFRLTILMDKVWTKPGHNLVQSLSSAKSLDNIGIRWTNTRPFLDKGWTNTGLKSFLWTKFGHGQTMDKPWTNFGQSLDKVWTLCPGFVQAPILHQHPITS